jgi:hypothetical protein
MGITGNDLVSRTRRWLSTPSNQYRARSTVISADLLQYVGRPDPDRAWAKIEKLRRDSKPIPAHLFETAVNNPDHRAAAAYSPWCPPQVLAQLAQDHEVHTVVRVASNPWTTPETLAQLASHDKQSVRYQVAKHPNCPPDALVQLATDPDPDVRRAAIAHCRLPEKYRQPYHTTH